MAVVEKAVLFYVYDSGVFQKMQGLFVQGSAGLPVRVVYEGELRGHFSRMLSAAEWEEQDRHCQSAEGGGGESTPHAGSSHDSESSSSADMSEREDGALATSAVGLLVSLQYPPIQITKRGKQNNGIFPPIK